MRLDISRVVDYPRECLRGYHLPCRSSGGGNSSSSLVFVAFATIGLSTLSLVLCSTTCLSSSRSHFNYILCFIFRMDTGRCSGFPICDVCYLASTMVSNTYQSTTRLYTALQD
ncbi:hypothetical protein CBL_07951 [Carabus blaptoides fortunei]